MSQNYYQVLGVSASAPAADIKQAYRRLATQLHPDKHQGSAHYEERFKAVAVAYGVLSDPDRRAQYDFRLRQAAQQAEASYRAAAAAPSPAGPSAYGAPTPGPQAPPLRTRRPAGARERHYQPRANRQQVRFNRQDFWLVAGIVGLILLFGLSAKIVMDRVAARTTYEEGRQAFAQGHWAAARQALDQSLGFRDSQAPALRLRGELAQYHEHRLRAACADYEAALLADTDPLPPPEAARTLLRLGNCQADLQQPVEAELSYSRALVLDTLLTDAYLARGNLRLLKLGRTAPALADLRRAHRQVQQTGQPVPLDLLQAEGAALTRLARYAEALALYQQALTADPANGLTLFLLGRLAQQAGDPAGACQFFQRGAAAGYDRAATEAARCQ